ncbi:MAG: alpha/beta hydrolase [Lachnospiraceae bacterium]|nr:alpha/beta hydrolase [Lachnospiraceae bacterium]
MSESYIPLTKEDREEMRATLGRTGGMREVMLRERTIPESYKANLDLVTQERISLTLPGAEVPVECVITMAKDREENCPVHVNMHGGGFVFPQDHDDDLYCAHVAARIHGIVVDIDYATSFDYAFPTAFNQCYGVMQWVFRKCEEWKADPKRVSYGGHSAGGNLTAALSLRAAQTGDFKPCLQILDYAALDNDMSVHEGTPTYNERSAAFSRLYCDGRMEQLKDPFVSPCFATDEMLKNQPKTLVIAAQKCPFREINEVYAKRLAAAGNEVSFRLFENSAHGFTIRMNGEEWMDAQELIIQAILESSL